MHTSNVEPRLRIRRFRTFFRCPVSKAIFSTFFFLFLFQRLRSTSSPRARKGLVLGFECTSCRVMIGRRGLRAWLWEWTRCGVGFSSLGFTNFTKQHSNFCVVGHCSLRNFQCLWPRMLLPSSFLHQAESDHPEQLLWVRGNTLSDTCKASGCTICTFAFSSDWVCHVAIPAASNT